MGQTLSILIMISIYIGYMDISPKIGVPQNGWFIMEKPIKIGNTHILGGGLKPLDVSPPKPSKDDSHVVVGPEPIVISGVMGPL